ncbi:PaiB family negative transcriptional regulator [Ulvibacter sp. MAR_2010_11]|uniref:FMN-binding negative transcriptional regulator n=1 Tax=Ulvibacter sp. MAR_2010_11 TaxID=1250229 RepID=UPI000C2B9BE4|nr:FMN-binding negative transcriptional regulator [Ulvibacter sp. MAR_2010_11]PKA83451.1 PaiB family negative transcriptional regulator [Ulvibacter sp. MAR_2010_11]
MYPPPYHQTDDIQKMITVIQHYPFGMLVSVLNGKPLVTHIPIIYNETSGKLVAHIDKFNPQVETLKDGAEVTVVFKGPDAYISPSVYATAQLPTWNYIIVHITGTITLINDPEAAKETMIAMTEFLERPDHKFILEKENIKMQHFVNYIQAFDITITNWEGKFKLSQDKYEQDRKNAKQHLIKKSGDAATGFIEAMYKA